MVTNSHCSESSSLTKTSTASMPAQSTVNDIDRERCCETIVVVGNGMVGLRFCEKLVAADINRRFRIVTFCEESRAAYDRVGLTNFLLIATPKS